MSSLHSFDRRLPVTVKLAVPLVSALAMWLAVGLLAIGIPTFRGELMRAEERRALTIALLVEAEYETGPEAASLHSYLASAVMRDPSLMLIRVYRVVAGRPAVWASSMDESATSHPVEPADIAPLQSGEILQEFETRDGRDILETIVPIRSVTQAPATVGVYLLLDPLTDAIARLSGEVVALALVAFVVQTASILLLVHLIVIRPIRRLDSAAARVAAGDLSVRLIDQSGPAGDEIARVTTAFDNMTRAVAEQRAAIEHLADTDGLTGLLNRRALDVRLEREIAQAKRLGYPLAFSLADLDGFKTLNDTRGHLAGDDALRRVADVLLVAVRHTDIVARYGGDEFAVIHPGCDLENAGVIARRVRAAIEALAIPTGGAARVLTASAGTALLSASDSVDALIGAADRSLYEEKARAGAVGVSAR